MRIQITGKSFNIPDSLKAHINDKIDGITGFFDNIIDFRIILTREKYRYLTEITLHTKGNDFVVNSSEKEVYYSVDSAMDKLEKQLKRFKSKVYKKTAKPKEEIFEEIEAKKEREEQEDEKPKIIRMNDNILSKPMTVDEAVIHLNQAIENLVVFQNTASGNIGIVFQRQDGNIGFIEPQR